MALTSSQRNALPRSAFLDRAGRRFPVPTKVQARRAGISERQRVATHRNALARAAQRQTGARVTPAHAARAVHVRRQGHGIAVSHPAARSTTLRAHQARMSAARARGATARRGGGGRRR